MGDDLDGTLRTHRTVSQTFCLNCSRGVTNETAYCKRMVIDSLYSCFMGII